MSIGLECRDVSYFTNESTVKATFNTPCELLGEYQERKPRGCCTKDEGIKPPGGGVENADGPRREFQTSTRVDFRIEFRVPDFLLDEIVSCVRCV